MELIKRQQFGQVKFFYNLCKTKGLVKSFSITELHRLI